MGFYLIQLLAVLAIASALSLLARRRFEVMLAPAVCGMIAVLYIAGLANVLRYGVWLVAGLAAAGLVLTVLRLARDPKAPGLLLTPGFAAFCLFALVIGAGTQGLMVKQWDEVSHWGLVVKNMFYLDAFGNKPGATTYFLGYPPATALFQYFFVRLRGAFVEGDLYRAMDILLAAFLLPVMKPLSWRDGWKVPVVALILFLLPAAFLFSGESPYSLLYVDYLLGVLFAYILFQYFSEDKNEKLPYVLMGAGSFVLALAKPSGAGIAAIALLIVFVDIVRKRPCNRSLLLWGIPLGMAALAGISWSVYLNASGVDKIWANSGNSFSWAGLLQLIGGTGPAYQRTAITSFIRAFFKFQSFGFIKFSYVLWLAAIALSGVILYKFAPSREQGKRAAVLALGLAAGFIVYLLSLLFVYVFMSLDYEAVQLASLQRYVDTYLLGAFIALVYQLIAIIPKENRKKTILGFVSALLALSLVINYGSLARFVLRQNISETQEFRQQHDAPETFRQFMDPATDRVFVIEQHSTGAFYWLARYDSTPIQTNPLNTWSLGPKYDAGDEWTTDIPKDAWAEMLTKEYTYVYIIQADDRFAQAYGALFADPIKPGTLYRIDKSGSAKILYNDNHNE